MMNDIGVWLESLGLAQYADAFADNDVGPDVLADLTEDHLKELGISLGNRLRLLKAGGAVSVGSVAKAAVVSHLNPPATLNGAS